MYMLNSIKEKIACLKSLVAEIKNSTKKQRIAWGSLMILQAILILWWF